jgi:hypothetical protein
MKKILIGLNCDKLYVNSLIFASLLSKSEKLLPG